MNAEAIGLPEALERAASELPESADAIRPANGDPGRLAELLEPGAALRVLSWLLRHEPDAGAELLEAWSEEPGAETLLAGIDPEELPKSARKALRRALHRLRSQGLAPPASEKAAVRVATLPRLDERVDEARVTDLDPRGVRVVYLAVGHPAGGVRLFELALDDERGVVEFDAFSSGRSRVRRFLRDVEQREHWAGVPAPPVAVRALIARALSRQATDCPIPRGFDEWRSRLCDAPAGTATPGELAREALDIGDLEMSSAEAAASVAERVRAGSIGPWPPRLERVQPLLDRLDEAARDVILVSGAARSEQVDRMLREALEEIYDEGLRERSAGRFEESAYVAWRGGREEQARICLSAARTFRELPASANPVARAMLERLLGPALQRAREGGASGASESGGGSPMRVKA